MAALQALVLAASFMILIAICSAQLAERPYPGSGTTAAFASAPLHRSSSAGLYSMQFRIGKTLVSGVIDTGSDLIWTNNSQLFESPVSCPFDAGEEMGMTCCHDLATFERRYGTGPASTFVRGVMGEASLTFEGPRDIYIGSAITFGCQSSSVEFDNGNTKQPCKAYNRGGVVGLGRGKLSLVSQLGLHSFSYCLPASSSADQATGLILFYDASAHPLEDGMTTTKLVTLNSQQATYQENSMYYVKLKQIMIGSTKWEVNLPEHCTSNGGGMMIIDSGSAITTLPKKGVDAIEGHLNKIIKEKTSADPKESNGYLCYTGTRPNEMDDLVLEFTDGAQMAIPAENYLFPKTMGATRQFCLGIKPQQDECGKSILAAHQQQGMYMLFDIQHDTLSFAKKGACGQSAQEVNHATM